MAFYLEQMKCFWKPWNMLLIKGIKHRFFYLPKSRMIATFNQYTDILCDFISNAKTIKFTDKYQLTIICKLCSCIRYHIYTKWIMGNKWTGSGRPELKREAKLFLSVDFPLIKCWIEISRISNFKYVVPILRGDEINF